VIVNCCAVTEESNTRIELVVHDTSIGIPFEYQDSIFNPFNKANSDRSIDENFDGNGLNLYVCKLICQHSGGDLTVLTEEGVGSSFSFHFKADLV